MRELLAYAAYHKVAAALGVSRTSVSQWAKGRDVTPYRVRQVRDLLRPPEPQDETEPQWARALLHRLNQMGEQVDGIAERWTTDEAPPWAAGLTGQIVSAIAAGQEDLIEAIAARVAADAARALDEGTDDEGQHGSGDQPGGPARPRPQLSP